MKNDKTHERKSGIELLKIIAMLFIIFSHVLPTESGYSPVQLVASNDLSTIVLCMMLYGGPLGVQIYTVCSAYYLLESKKVKNEKIISLLLTSCIISVLFLAVGVCTRIEMPKSYLIKQIFPFVFGNKWFFNSYIILYAVHPLLNKVVEFLKDNNYSRFMLMICILYGMLSFVEPNAVFYNRLAGMICIYFSTGYFKYVRSMNLTRSKCVRMAIFAGGIIIVEVLLSNLVGLRIPSLNHLVVRWAEISNPVLLLFTFSIFSLFKDIHMHNKAINTISSISLLVYLIHGNRIFIDYILPQFHRYIERNVLIGGVLGHVLLTGIIVIVSSYIISFMVKMTLIKPIDILSKEIQRRLRL